MRFSCVILNRPGIEEEEHTKSLPGESTMGNSYSSHAVLESKDSKLVSVEVNTLKERLNRLYTSHRTLDRPGLFEYLWDLKERALMEGSDRVEVPSNWLDDLEDTNQVRTH
jgi:hypothetical protein